MNIAWFTWKDKANPLAGGAELMNEELVRRLVKNGHNVKLFVGGWANCTRYEVVDGYEVYRIGNRVTTYLLSQLYFRKNFYSWANTIIEEINTVPYFIFANSKQKKYLFIYQLCREIWFYQMFFPISFIGYFIEPWYLWLLSRNSVFTESKSTRNDLLRFGFRRKNIHIIEPASNLVPCKKLLPKTLEFPTLLSLGAIRSMKRTKEQLLIFEKVRDRISSAKLVIAGDSSDNYAKQFFDMVKNSKYAKDISYLGIVSNKKKIDLMKNAHIIMVTSVKEGWGLIVTEAASQGTPAAVYDVDGLRDSVQSDKTGLISEPDSKKLSNKIVALLRNPDRYEKMRRVAWRNSKKLNFDRSYLQFEKLLLT